MLTKNINIKVPTYTATSASASNGATSITVADASGIAAGDIIYIEGYKVTVSGKSTNTLTFAPALTQGYSTGTSVMYYTKHLPRTTAGNVDILTDADYKGDATNVADALKYVNIFKAVAPNKTMNLNDDSAKRLVIPVGTDKWAT